MTVKLLRKSGHKFFEFIDDGVIRTCCVDGWINANICPRFCKPVLFDGWQCLPDDGYLNVFLDSSNHVVVCPTCFGYVSRKGAYRKSGPYHMRLFLDKSGLHQFLYNSNF